ncbi:hypothetical protein J6590_031168 [Homalodisca vitripennis]|nr:hypothetical protein J6590_031168 [Homalodisca vitripennis]
MLPDKQFHNIVDVAFFGPGPSLHIAADKRNLEWTNTGREGCQRWGGSWRVGVGRSVTFVVDAISGAKVDFTGIPPFPHHTSTADSLTYVTASLPP